MLDLYSEEAAIVKQNATHSLIEEKRIRVIDEPEGYLDLAFMQDGKIVCHSEITKWSPKIYKKGLIIFQDLIDELKKDGVEEIFALVRYNEESIFNTAVAFGFEYDMDLYDINLKPLYKQMKRKLS